jgi:hypothetical protein
MSFRQARQIVDFFIEVSEQELADKPELQDLRRMLLASALDYYQAFIEQAHDDASLQSQLGASHLRVASILDEIGSRAEALAALERAKQSQEKLVRSHPSAPDVQRGLRSVYRRFGDLRGGRELHWLSHDSVRKDLRLSADQLEALAQLRAKREAAFESGRDLSPEEFHAKFEELQVQEEALADLLRPEQQARLKQIALQQHGSEAFDDPEIVAALQLTPSQLEEIRQLRDEAHRSVRSSFRSGYFNPDEWEQVKRSSSETWKKVLGVLNEKQTASWKELTGEPFEGKLLRPPPRGGPRPERGRN